MGIVRPTFVPKPTGTFHALTREFLEFRKMAICRCFVELFSVDVSQRLIFLNGLKSVCYTVPEKYTNVRS